jgi:hypothetical protein
LSPSFIYRSKIGGLECRNDRQIPGKTLCSFCRHSGPWTSALGIGLKAQAIAVLRKRSALCRKGQQRIVHVVWNNGILGSLFQWPARLEKTLGRSRARLAAKFRKTSCVTLYLSQYSSAANADCPPT